MTYLEHDIPKTHKVSVVCTLHAREHMENKNYPALSISIVVAARVKNSPTHLRDNS